MAAPRPYIRIFWQMFGPISLLRANFDIKNELGWSKTFRLHPSKLNFELPEPDLDAPEAVHTYPPTLSAVERVGCRESSFIIVNFSLYIKYQYQLYPRKTVS